MTLNRDGGAELSLRRAWDADPGGRAVGRPLAKLLADSGRIEEAEAVLRQVMAREPNGDMARRLGELRLKRGDAAEAETLLRQAWDEAPGGRAAGRPLAKLLADSGRVEEAVLALRQVMAREPHGDVARRLGELRLTQGDEAEAEALFRRAWDADHGGRAAGRSLARLLAAHGRAREAAEVLRHVVERSPSVQDLITIADLLLRSAEMREAEGALRRALALERAHRGVIARLARLLQDSGRTEEAIALHREALSDAASDPMLLRDMAHCVMRAGRVQDAGELFLRAAETVATSPRCWLDLARHASRHESMRAAIAHLRRGRMRCEPNADLERAFAELLIGFGLTREAAGVLAEARARFGDDAKLLRFSALQDGLRGASGGAFEALERLARDHPTLKRECDVLQAGRLRQRWRLDEARRLLACLDRPTQGELNAMAQLDIMMANVADARASLRRAAALRPRGVKRNVSSGLMGAIVNDLAADREAVAAIKGAQKSGRWSDFSDAIRAFGHHTGVAMAAMIHLRQNGRLDTSAARDADWRIPKRIHQYWDEEVVPEDVRDLMDSWIAENPTFGHVRHSRQSARLYLSERTDENTQRAFRLALSAAGRADILRLAVLYEEGGVYADADDRCVAPLDPFLRGREFVARQEKLGSIGNNILAVRPRHPLIGAALNEAVRSVLRGDRDTIWLATGPGLMTRMVATHLAGDPKRLERLGRDMAIADLHETLRFCVSGCRASYKHTRSNWHRTEFDGAAETAASRPRGGVSPPSWPFSLVMRAAEPTA